MHRQDFPKAGHTRPENLRPVDQVPGKPFGLFTAPTVLSVSSSRFRMARLHLTFEKGIFEIEGTRNTWATFQSSWDATDNGPFIGGRTLEPRRCVHPNVKEALAPHRVQFP